MTSRAYGTRGSSSHYDVIYIVMSFATELAMPTVTDVRTYVTNVRTDTLPRLIYKDYNSPRSWPQHVRHVYTVGQRVYSHLLLYPSTHSVTRPVSSSPPLHFYRAPHVQYRCIVWCIVGLWPGVCLSQASVLSKWQNGSSWGGGLAQRLPSAYLR